tara:strand:+ start:41382 stop:42251 length:870 start_codon:yes stop_codon:yes gene_type:complete
MDKISDSYFLNGEEVLSLDITQKLFSSALFYGTGCFETMRFETDTICRFEDHLSRLYRGLEYLQLPNHLFPPSVFLEQKITNLVNKNGLNGKSAKIRVQCSLLENNGYHPDSDVELLTHVRVGKISSDVKPLRLLTAKTRVIPSECRPSGLKLSNMLHYRSAFREAIEQNYDDALMLSIDEYVAETSKANLFWVKGNRVRTPSIECSILPGIMRKNTIDAIKNCDTLSIEEGLYKKESIINADFVWVSNSVVEFCPVLSIDEVELNFNKDLLKEITTIIDNVNSRNSRR